MKSINWFKSASIADVLKEPNQPWEEIKETVNGFDVIAGNYLNGGYSSSHPPGFGNSWYWSIYKDGKCLACTLDDDNHNYNSPHSALSGAKKELTNWMNGEKVFYIKLQNRNY